jgi:hypothetical protein
MHPLTEPRAPSPHIFVHVASTSIHPAWEQYLIAA